MFGWRGRRRTGSDAGWGVTSGPVMLLDPQMRGQEARDGWPGASTVAGARNEGGWGDPVWDIPHAEPATWDDPAWEVGPRDPPSAGWTPGQGNAATSSRGKVPPEHHAGIDHVVGPVAEPPDSPPGAGDRPVSRRVRWWSREADRLEPQAPARDIASDITTVRQVGAGLADEPTSVTARGTRRLTRRWHPAPAQAGPHVTSGEPSGPQDRGPTGLGGILARDMAAEVGIYLGGGLVAIAFAVVISRTWPEWGQSARWLGPSLLAVALLATGLLLRLPLLSSIEGPLAAPRRRGISALLTAGATLAVVLMGIVLSVDEVSPIGVRALHGGVALVAALAVTTLARSPMAESVVLLALSWSCWLLFPAGPWAWVALATLGLCWSLLAWGRLGRLQVIRGERTAAVLGGLVALAACVGLAAGPWAWPTRGILVCVAGWGLMSFVRGGATAWLFLGAGAAAASGAAVAGDLLGPALALCAGGAATMLVSWLALRGTAVADTPFADMERARPPEGSGP